jgi:hypothetical protein
MRALDAEVLRMLVLALLCGAVVVWSVLAWWYRVGGTWERVLTEAERREGARPERFTLGQLGPFVTGRRDVPGGHQEFNGLLVGRTVRLTRRDHGVRALTDMGFPEPIAVRLEGEVLARLELRVKEGVWLEGTFSPRKVEFTHQPPRVTGVHDLPPQPRRYRRIDAVAVAAGAAERVVDDGLDAVPTPPT